MPASAARGTASCGHGQHRLVEVPARARRRRPNRATQPWGGWLAGSRTCTGRRAARRRRGDEASAPSPRAGRRGTRARRPRRRPRSRSTGDAARLAETWSRRRMRGPPVAAQVLTDAVRDLVERESAAGSFPFSEACAPSRRAPLLALRRLLPPAARLEASAAAARTSCVRLPERMASTRYRALTYIAATGSRTASPRPRACSTSSRTRSSAVSSRGGAGLRAAAGP